jgi:hypothetical protein
MTIIIEKACVVVLDVKKPRLLVQILGYIVKAGQRCGYFRILYWIRQIFKEPRILVGSSREKAVVFLK